VPNLIRHCAVLRLAHHGSRNGTDARWLEYVRPRLGVASVGATNDYGHPHAQALALLARLGIPLLRTDRDGTVAVASDGRRWWIEARRHPTRGPPGGDAQVGVAGHREQRGGGSKNPDRPIDLNSASQAELEGLPGIGPVLARRIIEGRPYHPVEDLLRVNGIGKARMEKIRPLVRVQQ
jgi:competence protein ComEC